MINWKRKQRHFYSCHCTHECKGKREKPDKSRRCYFQHERYIKQKRTRIHEGNFCTEGWGSLSLCRMDVNGFTYSYKPDEFIHGEKFNGKRWITTRKRCSLVLQPAFFLRRHCLGGQTQEIIKTNIWPEVARDLILIASQTPADAFNLGFKEDEQTEILEAPANKLPVFIGREFKLETTLRILEVRLKHGNRQMD